MEEEKKRNRIEIYVEDYANILFICVNVICDFNSKIYALKFTYLLEFSIFAAIR